MSRSILKVGGVLLALLAVPAVVLAVPMPVWWNTLDDDATALAGGGAARNGPLAYTPGADGNAFLGNGPSGSTQTGRSIVWNNAAVTAIFDGVWNNELGSTVDLYFSGDHWSSHTGDSGLWGLWARGGTSESHMIIQVQNKKLRMPYRAHNLNSTGVTVHLLSNVTLADNTTYRLTVRQLGTAFEAYLNGELVYTGVQQSGTVPLPSGGTTGREMVVGSKTQWSAGTLQAGEWVDNVRVYNGYYTPAEIGAIPEPASLLLLGLGAVAMLRRSRGR